MDFILQGRPKAGGEFIRSPRRRGRAACPALRTAHRAGQGATVTTTLLARKEWARSPRRIRDTRGTFLKRTLRFRRDASRYVSLVHPYCAFRTAFLGVVIAKFSGHVFILRSSPTVLADTRMSGSTSTRILSGKPPRAIWSLT